MIMNEKRLINGDEKAIFRTGSDKMDLKIQAANDLIDYLEAHEDDIACGINDFGSLKILFEDILQRPPKFT
jgi:hypothetical protein